MDSLNIENCFVCNQYMGTFKSELSVVTSYSEKPIYSLIQSITNTTFNEEVIIESGVCQNCFVKLNEYDEHLTKASNIEEELLEIMNLKDSEIDENVIHYDEDFIKDEQEDDNLIHEEPISNSYEPYEQEEVFLTESTENHDDTSGICEVAEEPKNLLFEIIVDDAKENISQKEQETISPKEVDLKSLEVYSKDKNQKFYQCDICNKVFKDKSKLKSHREIHTDQRNVVCPDCGKRFKTTNCLRNHKRLHLAERPYFNCDQCEKRYTQKVQLKKHIEIVHMQRRDFACYTCGASFGTNSVLKMHLLSHQEFRAEKCNICDYRFHTKAKLRRHMKSHTGERDYECNICGKKFLYSYNVVAHIRNVHEKLNKKKDSKNSSKMEEIIMQEIVEEDMFEYEEVCE